MRVYYSVIVTLLLCCLSFFCEAQQKSSRRPSAEPGVVAVLPFTLLNNHLVIPVTLSGTADTLHFIFDTGTEVTVLHSGLAEKLKLKGKQQAGVTGTNNSMLKVSTATLSALYLGQARLPFVKAYLENIPEFRNGPVPVDGFIGVDLLKAFVVKIDYRKQQMVLYRPGKAPSGGQLIPMRLNFSTPVIDATIQLPNGQSRSSRYHLITGGDYGILFNWRYTEKQKLPETLVTTSTDKVQDMLKPLVYVNSNIPALNIGPFRLSKVPVSYCKDVDDEGPFMEIAGGIGYEVWKQFTLTINYSQKELYLQQ